ncbi:hypothetical protein [Zunongwangia sp. HRR-M8]|uniref:hypothetical protein n=1 Tax=Zunongwangia sp. HRR-M8 TaxID=3015170 RepID=UPI0022DD3E7B|nr:hypothetical protein [Zunongwangia sp. HRR-M8]WBL20753.1 hypothetical protein PBT89_08400 [Zunongwangia sp. HRR-M8]
MKHLNFDLTKYRDKYRIHLGQTQWLTFENKTEAQKFLRSYKKILRDNVSLLNISHPTVNQIFRYNYFQFPERKINLYYRLFRDFDERFNYIFKRFSPGNANAFIFQNIQTCFNILIEIVEDMHVFGQRSKNYGITNVTKPLIVQLHQQKQQLEHTKRSIFIKDSSNVRILNTTSNESTTTKHSVGN